MPKRIRGLVLIGTCSDFLNNQLSFPKPALLGTVSWIDEGLSADATVRSVKLEKKLVSSLENSPELVMMFSTQLRPR